MPSLLVVPAVISLLLLAAHILHNGGGLWAAIACAAVSALLFSRNRWARYVVQVVLTLAVIEWFFTALELVHQRQALGEPWIRGAIILGAVTVFTGLAATLLIWRSAR